jgi:hypothetical protein
MPVARATPVAPIEADLSYLGTSSNAGALVSTD